MIKRILILQVICFQISGLFSQTESTNSFEDKLCKTWYVNELYQIREQGIIKDKTYEAKGSIIIFGKDNSFQLIDKSYGENNVPEGVWSKVKDRNLMVILSRDTLDFDLIMLSNDSLYLLGKMRGENFQVHIKMTAKFIEPNPIIEPVMPEVVKITESVDFDENIEMIEPEIFEEPEVVELPVKKTTLAKDLCKTWIMYKAYIGDMDISDETAGVIFIFRTDNTIELIEDGKSQRGTWKKISDKRISITNDDETIEMDIASITDYFLTLKGEEEGEYFTFMFKLKED